MKRSFAIAALLAGGLIASTAAQAADSIIGALLPGLGPGYAGVESGTYFTIYGTVDEFVDWNNGGNAASVRLLSGGAWTSKIGFYGQEDLGGGMNAHFRLENGFNANDGTFGAPNTIFNRGALVGIGSRTWGTVDVGKQFGVGNTLFADPFLQISKISPYNAFMTTLDLGSGASTIEARVNNSILYTSPSIAGFTGQLLYAFKGDQTQGPASQNRGADLTYYNGRLYTELTFNQVWCDPSVDACSDATVRNDVYGAVAIYDLGRLAIIGAFQELVPNKDGTLLSRLFSLGAAGRIGPNLLRGNVVYRNTSQDGNHAVGVTFGNDYFLSKRTALYVRASFVKNGPRSAMVNDYYNDTPVPTYGASVSDIGVGIYHHF